MRQVLSIFQMIADSHLKSEECVLAPCLYLLFPFFPPPSPPVPVASAFIKDCNIYHTIRLIFLSPLGFLLLSFTHTHTRTAWQELHLKEMREAGEQLDSAGEFLM